MAQDDLNPRFPSFPKIFSSLKDLSNWDKMSDKMTQWMGANKGIATSEDERKIYIEADLPGLLQEEITISLHQRTLTIQGEKKEENQDKEKRFHRRSQRNYYYEVELPASIQEDTEQADFVNGVLKITFDKSIQTPIKKIKIRSDSPDRF